MISMAARPVEVEVEQIVARPESDAGLIRSGLADVRQDGRDLRGALESFRDDVKAEFRSVWNAIDSLRKDLQAEIRDLRKEFQGEMRELRTEFRGEIRTLHGELGEQRKALEQHRAETQQQFREINQRLSKAMIWAVLLYAGLAGGLLYVLARGFKWL